MTGAGLFNSNIEGAVYGRTAEQPAAGISSQPPARWRGGGGGAAMQVE